MRAIALFFVLFLGGETPTLMQVQFGANYTF